MIVYFFNSRRLSLVDMLHIDSTVWKWSYDAERYVSFTV